MQRNQPPSGGCVLKQPLVNNIEFRDKPAAFGRLCVETANLRRASRTSCQPPSGGCVLKHLHRLSVALIFNQPPSGGCVLKLAPFSLVGRLKFQPPSGGCVLKHFYKTGGRVRLPPAAFGRLCVETDVIEPSKDKLGASRLRAAVC